jgi:hypothetical protein
MMGLATAHLVEVLVDDRLSDASARRPQVQATARRRHEPRRRLVGMSWLLSDRSHGR